MKSYKTELKFNHYPTTAFNRGFGVTRHEHPVVDTSYGTTYSLVIWNHVFNVVVRKSLNSEGKKRIKKVAT